jgi:hypothetical protein
MIFNPDVQEFGTWILKNRKNLHLVAFLTHFQIFVIAFEL